MRNCDQCEKHIPENSPPRKRFCDKRCSDAWHYEKRTRLKRLGTFISDSEGRDIPAGTVHLKMKMYHPSAPTKFVVPDNGFRWLYQTTEGKQ